MKQYTNQEQTDKLIELGFPEPKPSFYQNGASWIMCDGNYTIGELIEFLDTTKFRVDIGLGLAKPCYVNTSAPTFGETMITCQWGHELIDLLYNLCVKAKEEGVI